MHLIYYLVFSPKNVMVPSHENRRRARMWLLRFAGGGTRLAEARAMNLPAIVARGASQTRLRCYREQIEADLCRNRSDDTPEQRKDLLEVLLSWLTLNPSVGYAQGFHVVGGTLLRAFVDGGTKSPPHDTLASLSAACRINAAYTPLHASDNMPMIQSHATASQVWIDVSNHGGSRWRSSPNIMRWLVTFVLRCFPVLFGNVVANETALRRLWDFIAESDTPDDACRHITVALLLTQNPSLWHLGKDQDQNCQIFESLLQLLTPERAKLVVKSAAYLARVERIAGRAV